MFLLAAIASGCGGSGGKSSSNVTTANAVGTTSTTICRAGGTSSITARAPSTASPCGAGGGGGSASATSSIKLRLSVDGEYNGHVVKGPVVPGSLQCITISTGGKQGLQVTWGGTVSGTGQVSGDMMFAGGWTSITFGDGKSQGEASLVVKGDYQNRYGASSALGSGTEQASAGYSGGTINGELDGGSAGKIQLQGSWSC